MTPLVRALLEILYGAACMYFGLWCGKHPGRAR